MPPTSMSATATFLIPHHRAPIFQLLTPSSASPVPFPGCLTYQPLRPSSLTTHSGFRFDLSRFFNCSSTLSPSSTTSSGYVFADVSGFEEKCRLYCVTARMRERSTYRTVQGGAD